MACPWLACRGGEANANFVVKLTEHATPERVQAILRAIAFHNESSMPPLARRRVTLRSFDTYEISTPIFNRDVSIHLDVPPATVSVFGPAITFYSGSTLGIVSSTIEVAHEYPEALQGGTLRQDYPECRAGRSSEHSAGRAGSVTANTVLVDGVAIGTFTGGQGGVTFNFKLNSNVTLERLQTALRNLAFSNPLETPSTLKRNVWLRLDDIYARFSTPVNKAVIVASRTSGPPSPIPARYPRVRDQLHYRDAHGWRGSPGQRQSQLRRRQTHGLDFSRERGR